MTAVPNEVFPRAGSRARRFQRFERDLQAWLQTPEGRFALWRARRKIRSVTPRSRRTVP